MEEREIAPTQEQMRTVKQGDGNTKKGTVHVQVEGLFQCADQS